MTACPGIPGSSLIFIFINIDLNLIPNREKVRIRLILQHPKVDKIHSEKSRFFFSSKSFQYEAY